MLDKFGINFPYQMTEPMNRGGGMLKTALDFSGSGLKPSRSTINPRSLALGTQKKTLFPINGEICVSQAHQDLLQNLKVRLIILICKDNSKAPIHGL